MRLAHLDAQPTKMRIDCDLLTGFLGSGKTTLLNAWLRAPESAGTAVVVNEVGDIGIDQLVLAEVAENVLLLESGCLCCTLSGSLRETLLNVVAVARANGTALTRIVIETTGLAEPLPILHSLLGDKLLTETMRLNQVIVTVDGAQGLRQLRTQPESVRQLAAAEVVVITKTDLADAAALEALTHAIAGANPLAHVLTCTSGDEAVAVFTQQGGARQWDAVRDGSASAQGLAGLDRKAHDAHHAHGKYIEQEAPEAHDANAGNADVDHDDHDHDHDLDHDHDPDDDHDHAFHERVSTVSFYLDGPITWAGIAAWWHLVSRHYGDDLLRCKGLLRVEDARPPQIFLQTVGREFHRPEPIDHWPSDDQRSRLVCIGVGIDRSWLAHSLAALRIDEPGLLPPDLAALDSLIPQPSESR
ncbi:GTP-binding protein [Alcaligenaceae bacterium B3P038]|nr:GTP-binding protein [Alcaligenaceae bacterium B3P038]